MLRPFFPRDVAALLVTPLLQEPCECIHILFLPGRSSVPSAQHPIRFGESLLVHTKLKRKGREHGGPLLVERSPAVDGVLVGWDGVE